MGVIIDVDKYLNYNDYNLCAHECKWPWNITHFIKRNKCFNCNMQTNMTAPPHFILHNENQNIRRLLRTSYFWCKYCNFAVYEHYISEECEFCL
ncbi:unnamed protein product [Diatraea saccharalis]|uniref:Uncharacterized protein n=1 Tax=Diatraea saccharalis TaxID=40085 RepID=A0A9N9QZX0_9NEOP|nr:unnamed protein product [Diatraea saccharalis]